MAGGAEAPRGQAAGSPAPEVVKIPGWFHFREFYDLIAEKAPQGATIVEIGVYHGLSLIYLAIRRPDLKIVGVDWGRGCTYTGFQKTTDALVGNLEKTNLTSRIPIIVWDSSKAADFIKDASVWMVFIDGDHTYEGITKDIVAWLPKIQKGGIIAGDDYGGPGWPDVKKAVDEIYPEAEKMHPYTWWVEV